jgi:hypothetical protein
MALYDEAEQAQAVATMNRRCGIVLAVILAHALAVALLVL